MKKTVVLRLLVAVLLLALLVKACDVLMNPSRDVSKFPPYAGLAGQSVMLKRPVVLVGGDTGSGGGRDYQMYEADSGYQGSIDRPTVKVLLPAGTRVHIEEVRMIGYVVSGFSYPFVYGNAQHPQTGSKLEFEYRWGEKSLLRAWENNPLHWRFERAPWQDEAPAGFYALPTP